VRHWHLAKSELFVVHVLAKIFFFENSLVPNLSSAMKILRECFCDAINSYALPNLMQANQLNSIISRLLGVLKVEHGPYVC
jgi:hypothetical protein